MYADTREDTISAVRRFNRTFTRRIGVLRAGLLHSPYSLTEARILFEVAQRDNLTAAELGRALGLDAGYLSRTLAALDQRGLLEKVRSESDGRQRLLRLTPDGGDAFDLLDRRSRDEVGEMLDGLERHSLNTLVLITRARRWFHRHLSTPN